MERTNDWIGAVDSACLYLSLSPDECKKCKQAILLKEKRERSQFATVADGVIQSIHKLREFIATNKRDYLASGKITEQSKDQVEEQVGLAVQAITQHLEALKNGVIAAQRPADNSQPLVNAETAAHLHGAVLVLAEQLHGVTSSFDKCRALRYQQSLTKELRQHRKAPRSTMCQIQSAGDGWPPGSSPDNSSNPGSMQQAQQADATTQQLLNDLRTAAQQAQGIERSMREITTINQMISTAVMQQAELLEQLYNDAVDATHNIKAGNVQLKKTIHINRSTRYYLTVLLVIAGLLLLFFHWFNS